MSEFIQKIREKAWFIFNVAFGLLFAWLAFGGSFIDGLYLRIAGLSLSVFDNYLFLLTIWLAANAIHRYRRNSKLDAEGDEIFARNNAEIEELESKIGILATLTGKNSPQKARILELKRANRDIQDAIALRASFFVLLFVCLIMSLLFLPIIDGDTVSIQRLAYERTAAKYESQLNYLNKDSEERTKKSEFFGRYVESLKKTQEEFRKIGREDKVAEIQKEIDKVSVK